MKTGRTPQRLGSIGGGTGHRAPEGLIWWRMTDEPTRRRNTAPDARPDSARPNEPDAPTGAGQGFGVVPERPSSRPEAFSEREQPTLASPNSVATSSPASLEERLAGAIDRIRQLEADLENLYTQLEHLSDALSTEQLRGRAARMGRYLLWGAVIAAMATFWMLLRLRAGLR